MDGGCAVDPPAQIEDNYAQKREDSDLSREDRNMKSILKKIVALAMVFHLLAICAPQLASAVLIRTEETMTLPARIERLERIDEVLARDDVRGKLVELGVNPDEARLRIAALSEVELRQLEAGFDALPAGGDSVFWVLGVVFLVLLVLEIVGVIDIFKKV
jgi:hypothetical protein